MKNLTVSRWLACLLLAITGKASMAANTVEVLGATIASAPSCFSYKVTGACFFLSCKPVLHALPICRISTSVRVSHYMPDVVVSTYNDQYDHPWTDAGTFVSVIGSTVGSALLAMPLDSAANTTSAAQSVREPAAFKGADAVGNPLVAVNNVSNSLVVPNVLELAQFPGTVPQIAGEWVQAPAAVAQMVPAQIGQWLNDGVKLLGDIQKVVNTVGKVSNAIDNLSKVSDAIQTVSVAAEINKQLTTFKDVLTLVSTVASGGTSSGPADFLCPSSASPFAVYYQSDLDSYFWRGFIPLDLMYVGSWVPTLGEVSKSPLISTWGNVYPRTGQLVQQHPVKASAVYASRVSSIIRNNAQPHIYSQLAAKSPYSYVWFAQVADTKWSMVSPYPSGCVTFGDNDSTSLLSYGDGRTSDNNGYIWNMWNRYECCRRRSPIYLFSVP